MKICKNCGTQNPDENQICNQCQPPLNDKPINENPIVETPISVDTPTSVTDPSPVEQPKTKTNKKKIITISLAIVSVIIVFCILTATHVICLSHDWLPATCVEPAQCWKCDKYKDDVLGNHCWVQATCTEPKHCSLCYLEDGEPLGHAWQEPTCTNPSTCLVCGKTYGEVLEHNWLDATCEVPKTCELCGTTEGDTAEHTEGDWVTTQEATLTEEGSQELLCSVCGETIDSRDIDKKSPEVDGNVIKLATSKPG